MAIGARQYGATIHQQTPVTAMRQAADGGWELDTPRGGIKAKRVVNAAGFHARELGKMVGLDFPLVPVDHQYFVTNTIPEIAALKKEIPVLRDLEGSYYLRQERQGVIVGPYEPADKMRCVDDWYINDPPKDFGKELYPADLDRIQWNIERAMEFFPVLEKAEIVQVVSGPIMVSPDQLPMVGPCQGLRNYWTAIGAFGGVAYSGGLGKYLAGWIMNGEPPFDLIETDCNRYASWAGQDFTLAKAREVYGLTNAIIYPHEERFAGRPTKRTTDIYEQQIERGAEMGFHAGWEQPNWFALPGDEAGHKPSFHRTNWFEPVRRECDLVMTKAGIIDLTPFGKLEVFGPDACRFIDHVFANNVPKVGHTKISHMLTPTGHVYAEMTVTQTEPNRFLCITGATNERRDLGWLQEQAIAGNFDVACQTVTDDYAVLGLAGPKSRDIMAKLVTNDMSNSGFPFLTAQNCEVAGTKVKAVRISYTGELGWELYMNIHDIGTVYNALLEIGEEFGVSDFGTYAMNSLRLEKGFRMWGAEMGVNENPFEAGLEQFIATKKVADFIGKEALMKLRKEDLKRHLVFMTVDTSDVDPEGNESIWHNDKVVGMTTSGGYGYTVNQSLAFGYVPPELSTPGSRVYVELLGEKRPATICKDALLLTEPVRSAFPK